MAYSIAKSLFKNSVVMMIGQMITWISGFVLLMFLPRYLGSVEYGILYLALSIQMIFQWVIDYGGRRYISKEVSRDQNNVPDLFVHSAILRVLLWIVSVILTFGLCLVAKYSWHVILLIMILAISNLWTGITSLLRAFYLGFEDVKYPTIGSVVERSFLMLTAVPALLLGANEVVIVLLMAASTLLNFGIVAKFTKKFFQFRSAFRFERLKTMLTEGLPYFLWSLFGIIYFRIDAVMLSVMTPESVVGWYGAAYKLFDILMFLPSIFSSVLLPILSRLSASDYGTMKNTSQKSLEFLLLAAIPIAIGLLFFVGHIIQFLFGLTDYGNSIILVQIFAVGMLLVYADYVLGGTVIALDKQNQWAVVAFIAIFVNVGANYFLIPHFQATMKNGGIGAAIATDLTELYIMLSALWLLPRELFTRKLSLTIGKGVLSGVLMALVIFGGRYVGISWVVQAIMGTSTYVIFLFLFNVFEPAEKELLGKAVSVKNIRRVLMEKKGISA